MNKTPNYNLNQWEAEDRVLRTDFNADNAKIDAALSALAALTSDKADVSTLSALANRVAAVEPLARDHTTCGSFQGNETAGRAVSLPWEPKLVLLVGEVSGRSCLGVLTADFVMNIGLTVESFVYTPGFGDYNFFPVIQGSSLVMKSNHFNKGKVFYVAFR